MILNWTNQSPRQEAYLEIKNIWKQYKGYVQGHKNYNVQMPSNSFKINEMKTVRIKERNR